MPDKVPVVLSREEFGQLLKQLDGTMSIIVALLYGTGMRLEECLELRVKDLDFDRHQIVIRRGKGQKDRVTMLPGGVKERLMAHVAMVKRQHERDRACGEGRVVLPFALDRKYPGAATEWGWQSRTPFAGLALRSARVVAAFVTVLRLTCSKMATTFERFSSFSAIATCGRR